MFDLEKELRKWRREMLAAGINDPEVLDELASHLRDAVEQQLRSGSAEQQAWEKAVERMGQGHAIHREFENMGGTGASRRRRLEQLLLAGFTGAYLLVSGTALITHEMSFQERMSGFGALACTALLLYCGRWLYRWAPVMHDRRTRSAIQTASAVPACLWLILFFNYGLPLFEFSVSELMVTLLWAIAPAAAVAGIVQSLDEAARRRVTH